MHTCSRPDDCPSELAAAMAVVGWLLWVVRVMVVVGGGGHGGRSGEEW